MSESSRAPRSLVGALFAGVLCFAACSGAVGEGTDATARSLSQSGTPFYSLDLRARFALCPPALTDRRAAYDELTVVTALQGLANRAGPNLFLDFAPEDLTASHPSLDQLWLDRVKNDRSVGRGMLDNRAQVALPSVLAAVTQFKTHVKGLVVWDEQVPATLNAAFAVAGADDLLPVRYDASPGSYFTLLQQQGLRPQVWLVNADGSPLFKNGAKGNIPGTARASTGYAKDDVYLWLLEKYQKTKKLSATEGSYALDAFWLQHPQTQTWDSAGTTLVHQDQVLGKLGITNRDLMVAHRGFAYDLSPWADAPATDVPGQKSGVDLTVLKDILSTARALAGSSDIIHIHGFVPWQFKYTDAAGLTRGVYSNVHAEWTSVLAVSPYAAGLNADGLAPLVNASFFQFVPFDEAPAPQPRPTPEDLVGNGFLAGLGKNGGFEDGDDGWTLDTTNRRIYTDDATTGARAHSGLRFLQINANDAHHSVFQDAGGVAPGHTVTLRAFVRAHGTITVTAAIFALNGSKTEEVAQRLSVPATWTELKIQLPIQGAGHTHTRAQLYLEANGVNVDVDDVAFYEDDAASASVVPNNYVLWYAGDYDSAAWLYRWIPNKWDGAARGIIPIAWPVTADAARSTPHVLNHLLETRTPRDFFINADSGPAYANPGAITNPTLRKVWAEAGVRGARTMDASVGWMLSPRVLTDAQRTGAVTPFDGDGVLSTVTTAGSVKDGDLVQNAPIVNLGSPQPDGSGIAAEAPSNPTQPHFGAYRTTQTAGNQTAHIVGVSSALFTQNPAKHLRFVDPFTFFALARHAWGGVNRYRASYLDVSASPLVVGAPIRVQVTVRNDGWETWEHAGDHPYHLGFSLAAKPQASRGNPTYAVRLALPRDVPPGEAVTLQAALAAVPDARPRTVQVDLVREGVTWFENAGDIPAQVTVAPAE